MPTKLSFVIPPSLVERLEAVEDGFRRGCPTGTRPSRGVLVRRIIHAYPVASQKYHGDCGAAAGA